MALICYPLIQTGSPPSSPSALTDPLWLRSGSATRYTKPRSISFGTIPSFTARRAMGGGYTVARLVINRCGEVASVGRWYSVCLLCLFDSLTKILVDDCRLRNLRLPSSSPTQRI